LVDAFPIQNAPKEGRFCHYCLSALLRNRSLKRYKQIKGLKLNITQRCLADTASVYAITQIQVAVRRLGRIKDGQIAARDLIRDTRNKKIRNSKRNHSDTNNIQSHVFLLTTQHTLRAKIQTGVQHIARFIFVDYGNWTVLSKHVRQI
jgi:hypothetical protein